jgi:hypothetical protein
LGVSKRTIQRVFKRRKSKEFIHPYLGYFIKEMKIQKESDGKTIKNVGTKFIIYLDEPLTPEDQKKVAELMQQEEKKRVNDKA